MGGGIAGARFWALQRQGGRCEERLATLQDRRQPPLPFPLPVKHLVSTILKGMGTPSKGDWNAQVLGKQSLSQLFVSRLPSPWISCGKSLIP